MSEEKMGTNYVRELCATFRQLAGQGQASLVKEKLVALADELEPIATKLYFKTQKGTEDMQEMVKELDELEGKLAACQAAGEVQSLCNPFFVKLEKIIQHVKTMKVRMT